MNKLELLVRFKHVLTGGLFLLAICSCNKAMGAHEYSNPEIGLKLNYPTTWKVLKQQAISRAVTSSSERVGVTKSEIDEMQDLVSSVIFSIARPQKIGGTIRNPNLVVMALEVPEDQCTKINSDDFLRSEINTYEASMSGVTTQANKFPLSNSNVFNFAAAVVLKDRVATQYRYFYCRNSIYVQIISTSSDADDEREVREIIATIQVDKNGA